VVILIVLLAWRISVAIVRVFRPKPVAASAAVVGAAAPLERQPAE
jgi:hypothetical protein